jgi:uncharacterized protein
MPKNFASIAFTPKVQAQQEKHGSLSQYLRMAEYGPDTNRLGPSERDFIEARDGFYLATTGETGWPYIQFRGGPVGFLKVLDEQSIAFADFRGNRQYISVGNLSHDHRVALFLMDYPHQARLKILGRAEILEGPGAAKLIAGLQHPSYPAKVERAIRIRIEAFDWNCQQHIPQRYTLDQIRRQFETATAPLKTRIAELEREVESLRNGVKSD